MFPFAIAGGVRLKSYLDPDTAIRRLVEGLEDAGADADLATGHRIAFRGGVWVNDAGTLSVRSEGTATIVDYALSFGRFLLGTAGAAGALAGFFLVSNPMLGAGGTAFFFAAIWAAVYGVSVGIVILGFRRWLRQVTAADAPNDGLELETDGDESYSDPSPSQIAEVLAALRGGDDAFAVLSRGSREFIQVAGGPSEGFVIEYRDRQSRQLHRSSASNLPLDIVTRAFQLYAQGDPEWRSLATWKRVS
jgi:hypothetical protein